MEQTVPDMEEQRLYDRFACLPKPRYPFPDLTNPAMEEAREPSPVSRSPNRGPSPDSPPPGR
jgi:hypothetical protein